MKRSEIIDVVIKAVPGLVALYCFGSQARGEMRSGSDLDLAILVVRPLSATSRFDLAQRIAALVRQEVDLIDLRTASTVLQMQVVSTGECLHTVDDAERQRFESRVYSTYARLNEERREILKDIHERGLVYAR